MSQVSLFWIGIITKEMLQIFDAHGLRHYQAWGQKQVVIGKHNHRRSHFDYWLRRRLEPGSSQVFARSRRAWRSGADRRLGIGRPERDICRR